MISTVEKVLFLKSVPLFREIPGEELAQIAQIADEIEFLQDENVFKEGEIGEAMYATMNIAREDKMARLQQFVRNWEFFGAPVGLIFTIDRQMQQGQWADLGMFLQSIMLLAREHGLHTCAQEAWAVFHPVIREYLSVPDNEMIFCGMAIGHADDSAPINSLVSERAPLADWAIVRETA